MAERRAIEPKYQETACRRRLKYCSRLVDLPSNAAVKRSVNGTGSIRATYRAVSRYVEWVARQQTMADETIKRAAQEYLAVRLTEDGLTYEEKLNRDAAIALAPAVWRGVEERVIAMCAEWNTVTKEQTLTCKETVLGDLRIRCAGRSHQLILHYDSKRHFIQVENSAREDYEPEVILLIEGYSKDSGRDARLMRNDEPVNLEHLIVGQLRVLAGMSRKAQD